MGCIAANNGLIAVHIDSTIGTIVSSGRVFLQSSNTQVCCDNNCIRGIGSGIFFEVSESRNLYNLAEQATNVPCLNVTRVIIKAVSCKPSALSSQSWFSSSVYLASVIPEVPWVKAREGSE